MSTRVEPLITQRFNNSAESGLRRLLTLPDSQVYSAYSCMCGELKELRNDTHASIGTNRPLQSKESINSTSSFEREKLKTSKFDAILDLFTDLGITMLPRSI